MSYILECAIRGLAKSISYMNVFNQYINCDSCDEEIHVNFQNNFQNNKICNIMITNIVNNILFDVEFVDAGYDNDGQIGQLGEIIQFKCKKCNKFGNKIDVYDDETNEEMCFTCFENIQIKK